MSEKSTYLFFTEGSSDKEYHVHLRAEGALWGVHYANGPRGRVASSKPKTSTPVSLEDATKIFNDLVKSKMKGGYTEAQSGVRFTNTEAGKNASGHAQQLPAAISEDQASSLMRDPNFAAQEKANGERRSIEIVAGQVRGINKLGLYVNLPEPLVQELCALGDAFLDGEQIGSTFHAFDVLAWQGKDLRPMPFSVMQGELRTPSGNIELLQAAFSSDQKRNLLKWVEDERREGIVFKDISAPYEAGRSTKVFKYKLQESATCRVIAVNRQRSVQLGLLDAAGRVVPVGNVTIPANFAVPQIDELAEVQFLYFNPGGAFEQPVYLGPRTDIEPHEATLAQIQRVKPGVGMDEMGKRIDLAEAASADGAGQVDHHERQRG